MCHMSFAANCCGAVPVAKIFLTAGDVTIRPSYSIYDLFIAIILSANHRGYTVPRECPASIWSAV